MLSQAELSFYDMAPRHLMRIADALEKQNKLIEKQIEQTESLMTGSYLEKQELDEPELTDYKDSPPMKKPFWVVETDEPNERKEDGSRTDR